MGRNISSWHNPGPWGQDSGGPGKLRHLLHPTLLFTQVSFVPLPSTTTELSGHSPWGGKVALEGMWHPSPPTRQKVTSSPGTSALFQSRDYPQPKGAEESWWGTVQVLQEPVSLQPLTLCGSSGCWRSCRGLSFSDTTRGALLLQKSLWGGGQQEQRSVGWLSTGRGVGSWEPHHAHRVHARSHEGSIQRPLDSNPGATRPLNLFPQRSLTSYLRNREANEAAFTS